MRQNEDDDSRESKMSILVDINSDIDENLIPIMVEKPFNFPHSQLLFLSFLRAWLDLPQRRIPYIRWLWNYEWWDVGRGWNVRALFNWRSLMRCVFSFLHSLSLWFLHFNMSSIVIPSNLTLRLWVYLLFEVTIVVCVLFRLVLTYYNGAIFLLSSNSI